LSLPQNIHTTASPQFTAIGLGMAPANGRLEFSATTSAASGITFNSGSATFRIFMGGSNVTYLSRGGATDNGLSMDNAGAVTALLALSLGVQATTTSHAVRADRSITILGTANQVISSAGAQNFTADRTWTLSLPQNIHTGASPTFSALTASTSGFISLNPNNASANIALGWLADAPRLRIGGSGTGAGADFTIQGVSDFVRMSLTAAGAATFAASVTAPSITAGNLQLSTNNIISTNTNGAINLAPNGTGKVGIRTNSPNASYDIDLTGTSIHSGFAVFSNYLGSSTSSTGAFGVGWKI
jgi:hypothetical protein